MNIGIMDTENVAQALAGGWKESGYFITLGSREPDSQTDPPFLVAGSVAFLVSEAAPYITGNIADIDGRRL